MKSLFRRFFTFLIDLLAKSQPRLFFGHLLKKYLKELIRHLTAEVKPSGTWENAVLPDKIEGFGDLVFLFWSSILNRGIARLNLNEAAAIYRIVKSFPTASGVEIGRRMGGSSLLLAFAVGEKGKLLSIDIKPRGDEGLIKTLRKYGLYKRVELLTADANQIEREDKFDFVFIDGDHSYTGAKKDHLKWGAKVKVGGFIFHHDMSKTSEFAVQHSELKRLREDILKHQGEELELFLEADSLCVFRRKSDEWNSF